MADDAVRLFRMLVEAGAKPGEDFSYDLSSQSAQISDSAYAKLEATFPDIDWAQVCQRVEIDPSRSVERLNSYLGVDFVPRILTFVERRMDELTPGEATWYLQQVLGGVEHRTHVPLYLLLQRRLPLSKQARLETLLRQSGTPCYIWMKDLIEAAGGAPKDIELNGDEATLTQRGLALLTAIWDGEYDLIEEDDRPEDRTSAG